MLDLHDVIYFSTDCYSVRYPQSLQTVMTSRAHGAHRMNAGHWRIDAAGREADRSIREEPQTLSSDRRSIYKTI